MPTKYIKNRKGVCRNCKEVFEARGTRGNVPKYCYQDECQYVRKVQASSRDVRRQRAKRRITFQSVVCNDLCPAWEVCRVRVRYKLPIICGEVEIWDVDIHYEDEAKKANVQIPVLQ